jgi:sulfur carrier protein
MNINVNGKAFPAPDGVTLENLLLLLKVDRGKVIAELNEQVVQKTRWNETMLAEGDHLELISFVGGG